MSKQPNAFAILAARFARAFPALDVSQCAALAARGISLERDYGAARTDADVADVCRATEKWAADVAGEAVAARCAVSWSLVSAPHFALVVRLPGEPRPLAL